MLLNAVRYGLPAALVVAGFILLAVGSPSNRWEGFFMCLGAALAVLVLNLFIRIGIHGDRDREAEEAAREYFAQHGHWPDEAPRAQRPR